jgi:Electron transfer flavoprotein-ubiquinone oxidoreductase, 4Fe-4S
MDQNLYEWVGEGANLKYAINAQDACIAKPHDIKDPNGNITWHRPEDGCGPNYRTCGCRSNDLLWKGLMLTAEDCIALSDWTIEEIDAIAEHEHLSTVVAVGLGWYLLHRAAPSDAVPSQEARNYTSVSNCMLVSISVGDPWGPVGGAEP